MSRPNVTQWSSKDEAFEAGREMGFDRGYEEGRAAVTPAPAPRTVQDRATNERKVVKTGLVLVLAYGAWRFLKTWPGRLAVVGVLFALSGLVSIGMVAVALIVGAVAIAWAVRTAEKAAADTRSAVVATRAAVAAGRRRR